MKALLPEEFYDLGYHLKYVLYVKAMTFKRSLEKAKTWV